MSTHPPPASTSPVSAAQARRTSILLTAVVGMGALSIDMFLPSLPSMAAEFQAPASVAQLTVTLFVAGLALAQLVLGPLSDRLGRRPVLLGGMALYTAGAWACWLAPTMSALIAARVLQALGAGSGPVLGRAIVRDLYGPQRGARVLAYIGTAQALTPILAPILGGWLHAAFGWHSVFLVLAGFGAVFSLLVLTVVPESLPLRDPAALNPRRLAGNLRVLLGDCAFAGYVLVVTLCFCGQFAFISGSSYVLIAVVGVTPAVYGICFASVAFGLMTGSFAAGRLTRRLGLNPLVLAGTGICAAAGIVLAGLALARVNTVWAVVLPMYGYAIGVGLVLPTASAGAVGPYPRMAGLASALFGFLMMTGSAAYGVLVGSLFDGTARPMAVAIAMAGVLSLAAFWLLNRPHRASRTM
jgi:DHA1 family bicyclomycin/chloramphenicol resistance-like MFS transporter